MISVLSRQEMLDRILALPRAGEDGVLAFYEHRLGGICRDARLMLMPMDDHLAHRSDGVFETIRYSRGRLYRPDKHLERLQRSAAGIGLTLPVMSENLLEIILQTVAAGQEPEGMVRVLVGRGPGGFGIDPAECPAPSLYVVAYRHPTMPDAWYAAGLKGVRTSVPAKQGATAQIKAANYLPNVLMMLDAQAQGADVPFCYDADGFLAESATAALCLVDAAGTLLVPQSGGALPSTTVRRAVELLEGRVPHRQEPITEADVRQAAEILMLGTGPDCVAVTSYGGLSVGAGVEGPLCKELRRLIVEDAVASGTPIPFAGAV